MAADTNNADLERYSRQMLFGGIGSAGQEALLNARLAIIGCGALGSMQSEMLARAGIGFIRIVDRDIIETSNLHRQVMFDESDASERIPKAVAAATRIGAFNSQITVEAVVRDVNYSNIEELIRDVNLVVDGTDNFETRYLINDASIKLQKPWVYGAAVGGHGVQMTILPGQTPCLRCVFPDPPAPGTAPTCDTAGVILPIVGVVASFQVTEALKILIGQNAKLHHELLQWDVWENTSARIHLNRPDPECPACGKRNFEFLSGATGQLVSSLCGRDAVQISPGARHEVNFAVLAERLRKSQEVSYNRYLLRFAAESCEITVFQDARAIIKGTSDLAFARSIYAKYVGA